MSNTSPELSFLEHFTGIPLNDGTPDEERDEKLRQAHADIVSAEQAYEIKREKQALLLAQVRVELAPIKVKARTVLSTPLPSGPLKGKSFLVIEGEQIDEIEPETLDTLYNGKKKLSVTDIFGDLGPKVIEVKTKFDNLADRLVVAKYEVGGKTKPLFEDPEVIAEYWAPLRLERIYPDGLVDGKYSETQRMLDATNALYQEMNEQKKIAGQLTPDIDLFKEAVGLGKDLIGVSTEMLGAFAAGSEQVKMAKEILEGMSSALDASEQIYTQLKDSDYAGAASGGIGLAGKLTAALVGGFAGEAAGKATAAGFSIASSSVLMGKAMMEYRSGEGSLDDVLDAMGEMVATALTLAADETTGGKSEGLKTAAKAVPSAMRAASKVADLAKAVEAQDFPGVVKALAEITKEVLSNVPGLEGKEGDKSREELMEGAIKLGEAGMVMLYKMAVNAKRGDLTGAFNTAIDDIAENLDTILKMAGVPEDTAKTVVGAYKGSVSAAKAVQLLAENPSNVSGAMLLLGNGLDKALGGTKDPVLQDVGKGFKAAIETLVSAKKVAKLYKAKDYAGAVEEVKTGLGGGIESILKLALDGGGDDEEDDEEEDGEDGEEGKDGEKAETPEQRKLKREQRKAATETLAKLLENKDSGEKRQANPDALKAAIKSMEADREADERAAADEEARLMLAEAKMDLKALSDAERTGAEASNIDKMIADLLRDRMILKIATQIATGGADFLAQFVPALGAVSAGIKLAANLVAAAQRAQQLDAWIKAQKDLAAAQSALSSSAANFVKNQGQQLAHYSMQAFFAAAQLAGKITELAGPASPAGTILAAAAGASAKAEEMLMERKDKLDIEKAWKVTYKSLRNPKNRQLGLEARKLNPSLAKYSIAWGAVVLKDPLARDAMRSCGLTEASLKNDNTDVNKVVKFLEVFYEDDKTLYRDSSDPVPEWIPADAEISLKWWGQLRLAATTTPKLRLTNASLLEGLLGQLMTVEGEANASADAITVQRDLYVLLRDAMEAAMTTVGPDAPPLEPPSTEAIELAIDTHREVVARQYGLLIQAAAAYESCGAEAITPGKPGVEDPNIKEMKAVLRQLTAHASEAAKVAQLEVQGVESSKLALKSMTEQLRRKAQNKAASVKKQAEKEPA